MPSTFEGKAFIGKALGDQLRSVGGTIAGRNDGNIIARTHPAIMTDKTKETTRRPARQSAEQEQWAFRRKSAPPDIPDCAHAHALRVQWPG